MRFGLTGALVAVLALGALAGPDASAQEIPQGDAGRGKAIAYTCLGCHGIENYKNAQPVYSVPKLHGQHVEYIVTALQAYKSGERSHTTMHAQAASLSLQDMADIAAYFAGAPLKASGRDPAQAPQAVQVCVACHGPDGVGLTGQYPNLAGQHPDYIERALHDYKKGGRKNPIMAGFAGQLSDQQIAEVAAYYGAQAPGLSVEKRATSRFTAQR